jgi:hypothetical protein
MTRAGVFRTEQSQKVLRRHAAGSLCRDAIVSILAMKRLKAAWGTGF